MNRPIPVVVWFLAAVAPIVLPGYSAGESSPRPPITGASLRGTTGHVEVPSAAVTPEGSFRLGVSQLGRGRSDIGRTKQSNTMYYFTIGFLNPVELSFRATAFRETGVVVVGEQKVLDRALSGRIRLVREGRWPAVAVGADDLKGNRRTHSLYIVSSKNWTGHALSSTCSVGFGSRALRADAHLLDGFFAGGEAGIAHKVFFILENDSEKWNAGVRLSISQLAAQAAILGLDTLAGGVTWTRSF